MFDCDHMTYALRVEEFGVAVITLQSQQSQLIVITSGKSNQLCSISGGQDDELMTWRR